MSYNSRIIPIKIVTYYSQNYADILGSSLYRGRGYGRITEVSLMQQMLKVGLTPVATSSSVVYW